MLDLRMWCAEDDGVPPLETVSADVATATMGACGHVVFETASTSWLLSPDAQTQTDLGAISWPRFSPTGHLLAYRTDDAVVLRDLYSGEEVMGPPTNTFGFVPAVESNLGAIAWYCHDGELVRWTMDDSETLVETGEVDCPDVVGSAGSPKVAFVDGGKLAVVDLEDLDVVATPLVEDDAFGAQPWREIAISTDGTVVVHTILDEETVPDSDVSEIIIVQRSLVDVAEGRIVAQDEEVSFEFAPGHGHALLWRGATQARAYTPRRDWVSVPANDGMQFMGSDRMVLAHETIPTRLEAWRLDGGQVRQLGTLQEVRRLAASPEGDVLAAIERIDDCGEAQEAGTCHPGLMNLRTWTEATGLSQPLVTGFSLDIESVSSDGITVVNGQLLLDGEAPPVDGRPQDAAALVAANGEVLGSFQGGMVPSFDAEVLAQVEEGLLVRVGPYDAASIVLVSSRGEVTTTLEVGGIRSMSVDGRRERLAVLSDTTLRFGAW